MDFNDGKLQDHEYEAAEVERALKNLPSV